ncbi:MAG: hypothetical protein K8U57_24010 [Planctomycetes bacterium]|nr:hypothetical protein [Planctomycetota bacterium]
MSPAREKVLIFGTLGALGCLIGCVVGEGLLAAALPARTGEGSATPSLALRPETTPQAADQAAEPPKIERRAVAAPPPPELPVLAKRQAPQPAIPPGSQAPVLSKREPPPPLPPEIQKRLDEAGGKSGQLQFTLIWNNRNDLDLHCTDPNGVEIFYNHTKAEKSGGHLDVDRNVGGETLTPIENIYFPSNAPPGRYRVYAHHFARKGSPDPTEYTVNILIENRRLSFEGKISSGDDKRLIHEFTLPGLRVAVSPEAVLYRGSKNTFRVRVERHRLNKDPVRLTFAGDRLDLNLPDEVTIPENEDEAVVEVGTDTAAKLATRKLRVVAEGKFGKAEAVCAVAVQAPPASLQLTTPREVVVFPGGTNTISVRLDRQHNNQPVRLSFADESSGLVLPADVIVPGDRNEAEFEVAALLRAEAGSRKVRVAASGAHGKVEADCLVTVNIPSASLQLAVPKTVIVQAGESNRMTVRIARDWFDAPVYVRSRAANGVTIGGAIIPADRDSTELGVSAGPEAKEGTFTITLAANGGTATAETAVVVEVRPVPPAPAPAAMTTPVSSWSWRLVLVIGVWTALLAIGLSLALVVGQNHYLGRPWLTGRELGVVLAGGGLAGLVAGAIGQTLFSLVARSGIPPEFGFLAGWSLLGGLLGRGVCCFIPNLHASRSTLAGVVGGLLGALAFTVISKLSDVSGRFVGAAILGCCIGLMVALVELACRGAWLEVRYGSREMITVNLGPEPVKIGGDSTVCTVWARGATPIALRFFIRDGEVVCDNPVMKREIAVSDGFTKEVGNVTVIVHTGTNSLAAPATRPAPCLRAKPMPSRISSENDFDPFPVAVNAPQPTTPQPVATPATPVAVKTPVPKPPLPPAVPVATKTLPTPTRSKHPDACLGCGRVNTGKPKQRYCMICDRSY